jgi:hypothetical protein
MEVQANYIATCVHQATKYGVKALDVKEDAAARYTA